MNNIAQFLREVRVELSKVSWPTKKQLTQYTAMVIGLSLFVAVFLGALDAGFAYLLNTFILR